MRWRLAAVKLVSVNTLSHPKIDVLVNGTHSQGAYAIVDVSLPRGLEIPRHIRRDHTAVVHLLDGALELREDDEAPVVVRPGLITLVEGRPIAVRVLEPARLVAILTPAGPAQLLQAAADPGAVADDRAALLAAAGITSLPALRLS
jgi:hypothetical protein